MQNITLPLFNLFQELCRGIPKMMHRAAVREKPPLLFSCSHKTSLTSGGPALISVAFVSKIRAACFASATGGLFFCHSTALNVAAADVLQLNLNAESKETRARRKCPTPGSPTHRGPAQ